jgi:Outer membrane efflux protein
VDTHSADFGDFWSIMYRDQQSRLLDFAGYSFWRGTSHNRSWRQDRSNDNNPRRNQADLLRQVDSRGDTRCNERDFSMRSENRNRIARLAMLAIVVQSLAGCSPSQRRLNADREAYCTIAERNNDPRWSQSDLGIDMDPRSRYFDPYDPDCSPMPTDDPTAHRYMHRVDGMKGWKHWGDHGVRSGIENPQWRVRLAEYTEFADDGKVKLDVDSAVRLAYVHAPQHQRSLETLYLSSLDVTGERFRLNSQFFAGYGTRYAHQGKLSPARISYSPTLGRYLLLPPVNGVESNFLSVGRPAAASPALATSRRFATAGEVLVGFANSFVFEFTGSDVNLASSLANFSVVQPLLRGGGRYIALEQLTLSERRLLANLRAYSQFRQGFFTQIVIGELGVSGPERGGPDTVLQSFSGVGGAGGYLGLLQRAQQIRNTEDNLRLQLRTRDRLEALYDNELIDIVQVDQFRQNIEVTRSNLLDQTNGRELAVDNYITQILGLPSDLPVDVDEQLVKGFQLIPVESDPLVDSILELQTRVGDVGELLDLAIRVDELEKSLVDLADQDIDGVDFALLRLQGIVDAVARRLELLPNDLTLLEQATSSEGNLPELNRDSFTESLTRVQEVLDQLPQRFSAASERLETMMERLNEENLDLTLAENTAWLEEILLLSGNIVRIQSLVRNVNSEPERALESAELLVEPVSELFEITRGDVEQMNAIVPERERSMRDDEKELFRHDRERLHARFRELESGEVGFEAAVNELRRIREAYSDETREQTIVDLTAWIQSFVQLVERLSLIPAQARLEVITVKEVALEPEAAFQIALANRLDFMNGRAALVDRWRAIQIAANALKSNLTITGSGDVRTARNNPVDFRAATSNLRLGLEIDAPLARLLERNGYRETLIQYQRSRRSFIQSRDALQKGLRSLLRTLKQRRLQLEIQRRAVAIALRRVEQTQLSLLTPPPQGQPGVRPQINPTTAINLLGAQSSLQSSQNSMLAAWLNYYAARLRLFRELGVMQLDPSGKWIEDAVDFSAEIQVEDTSEPIDDAVIETLPPPIPDEVSKVDAAVEIKAISSFVIE